MSNDDLSKNDETGTEVKATATAGGPSVSDPVLEKAEDNASHWIWGALITGGLLTFAANYLIYDHRLGLGWAIFFVLLMLGIFLTRRNDEGSVGRGEVVLGLVFVLSILQMVNRPSFSNLLVIVVITLIAAAHYLQERDKQVALGIKFIEGIRQLILSPLRWVQATVLIGESGLANLPAIASNAPNTKAIVRWLQIVVPAVVLVVPFALLLGSGNGILGQLASNWIAGLIGALDDIEAPSPFRVIFTGFVATLILGLLWRSRPSRLIDTTVNRLARSLPVPSDLFVARMRTIVILVAVNGLFFLANSIDVAYLGGEGMRLPEHLTYSEFVHRGTYSLIASAIAAAVVISLLFQQSPEVITARGVRALALLWVAQNLLLITNVARRVGIYVADYDLSVLRVHLFLFLALVAIGFLLLAVRILWDRNFAWLVNANLAAVFVLFVMVQFWDTRGVVARYNFERAVEATQAGEAFLLDSAYLAKLGPSAWEVLRMAESDPRLSEESRDRARYHIREISMREFWDAQEEDWRDFGGQRARLRSKLKMVPE